MGGYARYVWPCYALTALVVGLNILGAALVAAPASARRDGASGEPCGRPHDAAAAASVLGARHSRRRRRSPAALALRAFQQNVMFYFDPSRIAAGEVKPGQRFRLGGMVEQGSLQAHPRLARGAFRGDRLQAQRAGAL
jgi:heme exporter protein CcmD